MSEYVLGTSDHELDRLGLQHEVWLEMTSETLDRLDLAAGDRALDLGCGPGFVLEMLRERVGGKGEVIGLDESARWIDHVRATSSKSNGSNVRLIQGRIEELELEPASVDAIVLRWVLAFLPEPEAALRALLPILRPGGRIVVIDYNHYGVSLFPESESFWAVIRATRALYTTRGGDPWLMGKIRGLLRSAGFETDPLRPYVLTGPPGSPPWRWAEAFFPFHTKGMVAAGVLSAEERRAFLDDWEERRANPDAQFFSPIVAAAIGRRPRLA